MGKTTVALSKCHNTKDKTNFLCSFGQGNFHETRRVVKLFVCTAKSIEIRKWEPALKPYENHRDKNRTIKSDPTNERSYHQFVLSGDMKLVTWRE